VQKVFYIEIDTGEELNASVGVNRKKSKDSTSAINPNFDIPLRRLSLTDRT